MSVPVALIGAALIAAVAFVLGRQTAPPALPRLDALAMMPGDHAYILSLRDTADGPAGTVLHSRTDPTSGILTGQAAGTHIADWHAPGTDAGRWHAQLIETREPPEPLLNDWTDRQGRRHTARLIAVVLPDGTALVKARDETELVERLRAAEQKAEDAEQRYQSLYRFVGDEFDLYATTRATSARATRAARMTADATQ